MSNVMKLLQIALKYAQIVALASSFDYRYTIFIDICIYTCVYIYTIYICMHAQHTHT
jgi:hypothetical protein